MDTYSLGGVSIAGEAYCGITISQCYNIVISQ